VLRAITDEIMYALMELSGQEYVDEYAQQAKNRLRSGRRLPPSPRRGGPALAPAPAPRRAGPAPAAAPVPEDGRPAVAERPVASGPGPDGA
jgi:1-acyl-sn-glycerol-3-phosphate acyltransferase